MDEVDNNNNFIIRGIRGTSTNISSYFIASDIFFNKGEELNFLLPRWEITIIVIELFINTKKCTSLKLFTPMYRYAIFTLL